MFELSCAPRLTRPRRATATPHFGTKEGRYLGPPRPSAVGALKTARLLLLVLLPLGLDIPLPLLASEFRRALPLELIPVDRQLVLDGDAVIPPRQPPLGGERQRTVHQLQVPELSLVLVRPAHRPGEVVPVLLDLQGGCPLLSADLILALPCPDRIDHLVVRRARQAAYPEDQRHWENRIHDRLRDRGATEAVQRRPPARRWQRLYPCRDR